jgi:hypothetical protein
LRTLLQRMVDVVNRISGAGAMLNARYELDRSVSSVVELDAQLRRVGATSANSSPYAA